MAWPNAGGTAPQSITVNYDALLTTTLANYRKTLADNIFSSSAFLAALRRYGGVETTDGGERIARLLMYEEHTHTGSYEGYDTIAVVPQDGLTQAHYRWGELASTITISRREERQNSGEAQIVSLFEQKVKQAEMSLKEELNRQLVRGTYASSGGSNDTFLPGNTEKDLNPLPWFLRRLRGTDPASTSNVGEIAAATYAWWMARAAACDTSTASTDGNDFAKDVTNFATLKTAMRSMYNWCSRGADGSGPNIVLMNQGTYEVYESALDAGTRYTDTALADMGFDTVRLKGASVIWDEHVVNLDEGYYGTNASYSSNNKEGTAFFINTNFMKLCIDRQTDFATTEFVTPENQTARTAKVLFMGNLTSSNQRKHGACYAISNTLTS